MNRIWIFFSVLILCSASFSSAAVESVCEGTKPISHTMILSLTDLIRRDRWEISTEFDIPGATLTFDEEGAILGFSGNAVHHQHDDYSVPGDYTVKGASKVIQFFGSPDSFVEIAHSCGPETYTEPDDTLIACLGASTTTTVLSMDGFGDTAKNGTNHCEHVMRRTAQTESGLSVLLPDWTSFDSSGAVLKTSSGNHAYAMRTCPLLQNDDQPFQVVISHYEHPKNHRFMPQPDIRFSTALQQALNRHGVSEARMAIHLEVGESERVIKSELLASTVTMPPGLANTISRQMEIDYLDDSRHRFSYFAILEVTASGVIILDQLVALPKCCPICPPGDPFCVEP